MDGASVVGLIAATIQLITFTKRAVERMESFVKETGDVPQALRILHRRLPLLSRILQEIQKQIERDELSLSEVPELAGVVEACSEELANVKERLQNSLLDSSDGCATRLKKAVKSLLADSKIKASVDVIESYISDLESYNIARAFSKIDEKTDLMFSALSQVMHLL